MVRWTENDVEALHLTKMMEALGEANSLAGFRLSNSDYIEGRIAGSDAGNNVGSDRGLGPSYYYGSVSLQTIDGSTHVIDLLDVKSVIDGWDALSPVFEAAGLIKMVDYPGMNRRRDR